MAKKNQIGNIAFLVGIIGSVVLGALSGLELFTAGIWFTVLLIVSGLVIGYMNITRSEAVPVMVSALVIGGGAGILATLPVVGTLIEAVLASLAKVILPAGITIALNTLVKTTNR